MMNMKKEGLKFQVSFNLSLKSICIYIRYVDLIKEDAVGNTGGKPCYRKLVGD